MLDHKRVPFTARVLDVRTGWLVLTAGSDGDYMESLLELRTRRPASASSRRRLREDRDLSCGLARPFGERGLHVGSQRRTISGDTDSVRVATIERARHGFECTRMS
jgi:hypothetical protein